jgi:hypothetical protein
VNRDSGSTYDRVSFLGYLPKTGVVIVSGWESPNSDEETYTAVLFVYMYFVGKTLQVRFFYSSKIPASGPGNGRTDLT